MAAALVGVEIGGAGAAVIGDRAAVMVRASRISEICTGRSLPRRGARLCSSSYSSAVASQGSEKCRLDLARARVSRSEEHTSELQSLMRISYAVFCLNKQQKLQLQTHKCNKSIQCRNTHTKV